MCEWPFHGLGLDKGPRDVAELGFTSQLRFGLLGLEPDHFPHRIEVAVRHVARSGTHAGGRVLGAGGVLTRSLFGAGRLLGSSLLLSDLGPTFASLHLGLICFLRDDSLPVSVNWLEILLLLLLVHFGSKLPLVERPRHRVRSHLHGLSSIVGIRVVREIWHLVRSCGMQWMIRR